MSSASLSATAFASSSSYGFANRQAAVSTRPALRKPSASSCYARNAAATVSVPVLRFSQGAGAQSAPSDIDSVSSTVARVIEIAVATANAAQIPSVPASLVLSDLPLARITIMSAFRKDLFISVTLPVLGLLSLFIGISGGAFGYAYAVSQSAANDLQVLRQEAQKDRDTLAVRLEDLRKATEEARRSSDDKLDRVVTQLSQMNANLMVLSSKVEK